jgi:hypothetical protein
VLLTSNVSSLAVSNRVFSVLLGMNPLIAASSISKK